MPNHGSPQNGPEEELSYLRARVHKIADAAQTHEVSIHELKLEVAILKGSLAALSATSVTSDQLKSSIELLRVEFRQLHADLALIKRAIYWAATVIIGAVILALLSLVIRGPA